MADLQWLKLSTNFFDNNKIKLLESERDGDRLIRVWIQLLTIAMKCNYQSRRICMATAGVFPKRKIFN